MYITRVPNRNSPPAVLLRESYRENGKVKSRTLANLTNLPPEAIEAVGASSAFGGGICSFSSDQRSGGKYQMENNACWLE